MESYSKTYKDDIYFFIPMSSDMVSGTTQLLEEIHEREIANERALNLNPEKHFTGEAYCDILNAHIDYECDSDIFRRPKTKRYFLGKFLCAGFDDNYNTEEDYHNRIYNEDDAYLFITANHNTGLYIVTLAIPNDNYIPSQLIDQMSTQHLEIFDNETNGYIAVDKYIKNKLNLSVCGDSKCVVCLSNHPKTKIELAYLLAGETMVSKSIDYHLKQNRINQMLENRACYDYYDSYISRSVIAFVFKEYSDNIYSRIQDEASELFIVEIVLFQNTAILRTNKKVIGMLENDNGISSQEIDDLYKEFGKTMGFWSTNIYKYPFSQLEADEVIKSFGINEILDEYHRNQQFLDRLIEIKGDIANRKTDKLMSYILYFLSCVESASLTLSAVLWGINTFVDKSKVDYETLTIATRFGWVTIYVLFAVGLLSFFTRRYLKNKDEVNAKKEKRKQRRAQKLKNKQKP